MPRTSTYEITYRERAGVEKEFWALFQGERKNAVLSCQRLLIELRQLDRKASVFLNGKRIQMPEVVCPWCHRFEEIGLFQGRWLLCEGCGLKFNKSGRFHPNLKMLNMGILVVWDETEIF